jgi:hypothetical protein
MQDFGKYGVVDQMDKHKLYRAIKQARVQQEQQLSAGLGQYELSGNSGGDLLDLDAHDGDLIEVGGLASQPNHAQLLVPCCHLLLHVLRSASTAANPDNSQSCLVPACCLQGPCQPFQVSPQADRVGSAQMAPQDPPKIRVVVRKRPINKKVGLWL